MPSVLYAGAVWAWALAQASRNLVVPCSGLDHAAADAAQKAYLAKYGKTSGQYGYIADLCTVRKQPGAMFQ